MQGLARKPSSESVMDICSGFPPIFLNLDNVKLPGPKISNYGAINGRKARSLYHFYIPGANAHVLLSIQCALLYMWMHGMHGIQDGKDGGTELRMTMTMSGSMIDPVMIVPTCVRSH